MAGVILADDYLDPDVAYLLGMIVARGTLIEQQALREIVIEFPYQNLNVAIDDVDGHRSIDIPQSIELGIGRIRERVLELLDCDIRINRFDNKLDMVLTMTRRTMAWRNILLHVDNKTNYRANEGMYWTPKSYFRSKNPYFATLKESDGGWSSDGANQEAFRRSCHNIMQAWRDLNIVRQQVNEQLALAI